MSRIEEALAKTRSAGVSPGRTSKLEKSKLRDFDKRADSTGIDFNALPMYELEAELFDAKHIVAVQADIASRATYKILRTRILHRMRAANWNILGVSGSSPGEGKTLTAINLAYSMSHDVNYRVVLVDLDLRRPSLHSVLEIEQKHDLQSYLTGKAELKDILVRPGEKRMAIITNKTAHRDSSEILSSPQIVNLVGELRALGPNTIIIFDLPPVLAGDDVLAISPLIDAHLLVVAEGLCKRQNLLGMHELLKETEVIGTVLNRSRERSSSLDYYGYY